MDENLKNTIRKARLLNHLKLKEETGCLEWAASRYKTGYGQFHWGTVNGKWKVMKAHRAAWLLLQGEIPSDRQVLHRCNNRSCCNVNHLYLGTHQQNMRDREDAGHTSRGTHRYNFRRSPELTAAIKAALREGKMVADVCRDLKIGWTTFYRCRDADEGLRALIKETKKARYTAARHRRGP